MTCQLTEIKPLSQWKVSIDADPKRRWRHVVLRFARKINRAIDAVSENMSEKLRSALNDCGDLESLPFICEMKAIAALLNRSVADVVLFQLACVALTHSTTVLLQTEPKTIYQLIYADVAKVARLFSEICVQVSFTRKRGRLAVYAGVTFAGCVGLLCGQNERQTLALVQCSKQSSSSLLAPLALRLFLGGGRSAKMSQPVCCQMLQHSNGSACIVSVHMDSGRQRFFPSPPNKPFIVQSLDRKQSRVCNDRLTALGSSAFYERSMSTFCDVQLALHNKTVCAYRLGDCFDANSIAARSGKPFVVASAK